MTADTEAGGRGTTAAEGESSAVGSSCSAMMIDPTSVWRSSGSSRKHGVVGVVRKITDHVRVTNVVDRGPGELAKTARSRTNSTSDFTTASDSTPCLCTARG